MVPIILGILHNVPTGGHLGVQKLQGKVRDRFYWPGWYKGTERWCKECAPCAPLVSSVASYPYERIALDIVGPLPETNHRNKYILVIGDYFSKWTEAFPLPNQEAQTVAKCLVEEWVCRYGAARSIHTDQGRNFESCLFKEVCRLLSMHKTRTSPYHENQQNWDTLLPYVMMAYRSSVQSSTGFTPYRILFGREIVLLVDVMFDVGAQERFQTPSEYVSRLAESLSTVVGAVRGHQMKASEKQKKYFDFKLLDQEKGVEMIIHFNRLKPHVSSSLTGVPVLQGGGPERPPPPVMTSGVAHKSPVQELTLGGIFAPSLTMATMTVPGALNIAPVNGLVPRVSETHGASAPLAEIESAPLLAPETITAADMEYAPVVVTVPPSGLTASADRMPAVAGVPGSEIVSESSSGPTTSVDDGLVPVDKVSSEDERYAD
ncbi:hypothetical protein ABG768_025692 [Culter alburnus]|uniref:Gypsy retrotransposon integrase-like protein 1 n=1 Tax=Culter alburnus TaxID=194366 RepID=A0AAW2AIB3_CULAL